MLDKAAEISQQHGLLTNDALLVAVMREHGLTNLASQDADFDRVPGLIRHAPA
jgi:predicted nucleic acid-binding protein